MEGMLIYVAIDTALDIGGVHASQQDPMRISYQECNKSSSSLEGMEKPIRSFKSFIRAVPPNPTTNNSTSDKPLPPTPSRDIVLPSPSSPPASPGRSPSVTSWIAPADWLHSDTPSPLEKTATQTPPVPIGRTYSPLLPDPSPDLADMSLNLRVGQAGIQSQHSRLLPIYEGTNKDLGPPCEPPRSPLPLLPKHPSAPNRPNPIVHPKPGTILPSERSISPKQAHIQDGARLASPVGSATSYISHASTKAKAYASLGIGSPRERAHISDDDMLGSPTNAHDHAQTSRQHPQARRLRAPHGPECLSDDRWEEDDLDEETRQLSFSQDYHDLLAEQYHEMSRGSGKALGPRDSMQGISESTDRATTTKQSPFDLKLVPRPLAWRKGSNNPRSRKGSRSGAVTFAPGTGHLEEEQNAPGTTSWVPRHLRVASQKRRSKNDAQFGLFARGALNSNTQRPAKPRRTAKISSPSAGSSAARSLADDLSFSTFFPRSKTKRKPKRSATEPLVGKAERETKDVTPVLQPTGRMLRLPGGLAIVRTSPSPAPQSTSEPAEPASLASPLPYSVLSEGPSTSQNPTSTQAFDHCTSPGSNPSDHRSSYNSSQSATRAPILTKRDSFQLQSSNSSNLSSPKGPSLPHTPTSNPTSSPKSLETPIPPSARSLQPHGCEEDDEDVHKQGFIEKAIEARKKHNQELRKEKLKRSIKVLGPTDPKLVASYVKEDAVGGDSKRLPGYLISGPF